jgi:hypothetical protein
MAQFQINNPLLLFGRPFLASLKCAFTSPTEFTTVMVVIVTVILASLCGPSSGIVMLPRLDWWPFPDKHPANDLFSCQKLDVMILKASFEDLFPTKIDDLMSTSFLWSSEFEKSAFSSRLDNILDGVGQVFVKDRETIAINISVIDQSTSESFPCIFKGRQIPQQIPQP